MALLTRFGQPIDPERFLAAFVAVASRSDALRTTVRDVDGVPHPRVEAELPSHPRIARVRPEDLESWICERIAAPLDVSVAAFESVLLDLGGDKWAWFLNVHHLAIDAGSSAQLFNAVARQYQGESTELFNYERVWSDLVEGVKPDRADAARDFWAMQPDPVPTQLYMAGEPTTAAERVSIDMSNGRQVAFDDFLSDSRFKLLSAELSQAVALALAMASYLARLGNDEITIGVPIHHRSTKEARGVIGPLVEFFPLRVEIAADDTFVSLHKKISRGFLTLLSNALPGTSPRQSFDLVLNVHAATLGDFGAVDATTSWIHPGHVDAHHLLRLQALDYDGSGVLELALDINHAAARSDQRRRASRHFSAVFDAMVADPERSIHSFSLLDSDERLLLAPFTSPSEGTPIDGLVPEVLAQRLEFHADRPTIRTPDGVQLSGAAVDANITQAAARLREAGYGPGDLIAVEMGVGLEAVIAIHGIQRAGAAFVPIDPTYPQARRDHIRSDSGARLVLRDLSELDELMVVGPSREDTAGLDDVAYVIYTSGSTGLPKGVPISYRGLSEYLGFAYSSYIDSDSPTMPLFTSLSFDLTITTLFLPLLSGGLMTIHPEGGLVALREIADLGLATLIKATPSHLELLVRMLATDNRMSKLSGLIVGGEAFMTDLADRLVEVCGESLAIFNEYGPTEAVVGAMIHRYDPDNDPGPEVPIGRPAPGVALHVLDPFGYPVPVGVSGELYIHRPGMTEGYLGRDDLTEERLAEVVESGSSDVLYSTGDLVRMSTPEAMVYLGRIDEQIKIGGVRLEPGEIEHIAQSVPGVRRAVARLWSPQSDRNIEHCVRCGLPSDVPDVSIDGDGVCTSCHQFELVAPQAEEWFRSEADLVAALANARERSTGDYDVIHLISGGKDSTYALYKLVELGARVFAITLDNGYLAEVAKANVRRATKALGVDHEFVTIDGMDEIFRDSLERFSNVCHGCYKAIYTIALAKAEELRTSAIVTGLSRGQFFETRLVPEMFGEERFDPDAIDEMVREARHVYHTTPDAVSENMDVDFLADGEIFDRIDFIDLYRYVDVPLSEMYAALEANDTWQRPPDSGRSTNCLINAAGIFVHKMEQGHHNYAAPYSWDVRLGHKTRAEVLHELDDPMDTAEIAAITTMLAEVGYEPKKPEMLTLWIEAEDDFDVSLVESAIAQGVPTHSIPRAIEVVGEIPLTANGKVDARALPDPALWRTSPSTSGRAVDSQTERDVAEVWSTVLGIAEVSATDDFFALGGTSLHALEMIVRVSDHFDIHISESVAFKMRTVAELASYIDAQTDAATDSERTSARAHNSITSLPENQKLPLSAGEQAMLYEWRRNPDDRRYNVARLYRLGDDVDLDRLDAAIRSVIAHQATLRTSYGFDRAPLEIDAALRTGRVASTTETFAEMATTLNESTYDLVSGPLISVQHLKSAAPADVGQRGLFIGTHHIVSDAGSLDVLWDQIDLAYRGLPLPELASSYAEHGAWQAQRSREPAELWAPKAPVANLGIRAAAPVEDGSSKDGYVHAEAMVSAAQLRSAPAPTLFANALTALSAALRPFHDGSNVEVTITSSVRDHPAVDPVVGYFLNPLPLLLQVEPTASLAELARSTADELVRALEHRAVPFASVVASARERGITPPSGRVMLAVEDLAPAALDGKPVQHSILSSGTAVNDLTFFLQIRGEKVELGCEFNGATIGRAMAVTLLDAFSAALESLVHHSDESVGALAKRPEALSGAPFVDDPRPAHQLISEVIATNADAPAVHSGSESLTYGQVDEQARAIAARLRGIGVVSGDRVALCLPRSVDLIPAIWATWILGASYVPIDSSQPASRVIALLSAADVTAAVSTGVAGPGLAEVPTVRIDRPDAAVLPFIRPSFAGLDGEAYVIFTSGSTGYPKGVPISHANLAASLQARKQWYDEPVDKFLMVSSAGFDSSVAGIFWTLVDGGELVIPTEQQVHNVDELLALAADHSVTHGLMVPSLYGAMLQRDASALTALKTMIVAGEACPPALVDRHFADLTGVELVNEYGPTEATVWSTAYRCVPEDAHQATVPIGSPIAAMTAELVDPQGTPVPLDVAGELWLSGPGVSRGYLSDNDSSEGSAFVSGRHEHLTYRTGDLCVRRASGSIEFLGRVDDQLSIGGVRIEPSEVEAVFTNLDAVEACLVGAVGRDLVAFVELNSDSPERVDAQALRVEASALLAPTHVPKQIRFVDALPRNDNGKLDRAALDPSLGHSAAGEEETKLVPPPVADDAIVAKVVEIFSAAFDGAEVVPSSDFFDLGGDSLRAVAVVSMLENEFGRRVAIGELIDAPTPELLASQKIAAGGVKTSRPVGLSKGPERLQHRLVEWLRSSGSGRPFIVLPPGGGNLMRYEPLVRSIDKNIPVLGIRLPGADARSAIEPTIQRQADVMLAALDSAVSEGPYRLLGWSTGGLLAWEIARQLTDRGDEVEAVVLVDTVMAGLRVDESGTVKEKYQDLFRSDGVTGVAKEGAGRLYERANFALARRRYREARESGETPSLSDAERQLGPVIRRAAARYSPKAQDVPVIYVSASESSNEVTVDLWRQLQSDSPFELITIEGVHYMPEEQCIIGRRKAPELVGQLRKILDL